MEDNTFGQGLSPTTDSSRNELNNQNTLKNKSINEIKVNIENKERKSPVSLKNSVTTNHSHSQS